MRAINDQERAVSGNRRRSGKIAQLPVYCLVFTPLRHRRCSESGFGLVGAIVLSTALLLVATALMTVVLSGFRYQHRAYLATKATSIAEGGADYAVYKLNQPGSTYAGETGTSFGGGSYDVQVVNVNSTTKQVTVTATIPSGIRPLVRKIRLILSSTPSDQASFSYAIQVGNGGLEMNNSSKVLGNVYSNGNAEGNNSAQIVGDLWVAGATGSISGFRGPGSDYGIKRAGSGDGDGHAHTISESDIQGDAFYGCTGCISGTTVAGAKYPGSPDPPPLPMPITDAQINEWKSEAEAGGTQGSFTQSSGTWSLGPRKIAGELKLSGTATLNLTGALWVTGKVTVSNSAIIQIDPGFGPNGTMLISDAQIVISNSAILRGSGNPGNYLLALSTAAGFDALVIQNDTQADILYTSAGETEISNNVKLKQVTADRLEVKNNAVLTYQSGLASASFSTGPGGRWTVTAWQELR